MANESNIDVNVRGHDGLSPQLAAMESKLIRFVGAVSSALTAIRVVGFPVTAVRQFEAQMANVQKTTNFTDNQIKTLSASLVDMSRQINVSATDLASIAAAAGQQGLGREGVEGIRQFTESVSRMSSVLDITVEDAGANVGKIASIFKINLRDIESAISSFNQVSNNSTATGENLLDVVRRIGDAAGSLKIDQAIGVAATGLDFGQSPEVVGTSFAKIFADMFGKADQFAKLLKISTTEWLDILQKDGIKGLKMYLDGLRNLTADQQQKWIKQLSGGGRIGVLLTKLVRDTDNAVLDRNLGNALEGKNSGTSAIREQLTVLKTLDAEIDKAYNSFEALGIKAGEVFGPRLAGYFAQLNAALADPAVINFAEAVGSAFLDMFDAIANGIKFLAGLNVNWENFVQVAKVLLTLKLAQWIIGALGQVPLLGGALTKLGLDAVKAGDMQARGSAVANTAIQNQIIRIKELMANRAAYLEAVKAQSAAEIALSKAVEKQKIAEANAAKANGKLKTAQAGVNAAGAAINQARGGISQAQTVAAARVAAVQQQLQDRLLRAEAEAEARRVAIVAKAEQARGVARAQGNKQMVAAVNLAQKESLAAEAAYQARSLTQINAYYARRIQQAQATGAAEVAASRLAFMQSLSSFDGVAGSKGFGVLTTQARLAQAALTDADRAVVAANANLQAANAAATTAGAAYGRVATGVRLLGNAFSFLLGIAGKVFFWFTIIYTALDAFGVLNNVSGWFQTLTDKIGLTSEARRQDAQRARNQKDEQDKLNASMREAIELLDQYIDKSTGQLSGAFKQTLEQGLGDADPNVQQKALNDLVNAVEGTYAKLESAKKAGGALPGLAADTKAELDRVKAAIAQGETDIANLRTRQRTAAGSRFGGIAENQAIKAAQAEVDALKRQAEDLEKSLGGMGASAANATSVAVSNAQKDLATLQGYVEQAFTPQSAEAFVKFAPEYLKALEDKAAAEKTLQSAQEEYSKSRGTAEEEVRKQAVETATTMLETSNNVIAQVMQNLGAYIEQIKAQGNLTDAMLGSLDRLPSFFQNSTQQLQGMLTLMQSIAATGAGFANFTGKLAPPKTAPATGDGSFDGGKTGAGEARALSKARVALARAGLEAEANLQKQFITEAQEALDHANDRALVSIRDYYAKRVDLQRKNIDIESKLKRDEIAALNKELGEADVESARVRVRAQIVKAEGDIKLLQQQRKALADSNNRDLEDALREFNDQVVAQRNTLVDYFGATSDNEAFQASLAAAQASYRDFVQRLRTEAAGQPELLKIADAVEMQASFQAVEAALDRIGREASLTQGHFDLLDSRISALRENGLITSDEASGAYAKIRQEIIKVKEAELARSRAQLQQLFDANKSLDGQSLKYKELALQISQGQVELDNLKIQANDTAKEINEGVKGSLSGLFMDLANGAEDAVNTFITNLTNAVAQRAADGLAETIIEGMGGMGGGVGGFFSGLFGGETSMLDTKGTELNPMIVREAATGGLLGGAADAAKGEDGIISKGLDAVTGATEGLGSKLMGGLEGVTTGVGDFFSQGINMLTGFLGPLFSSLIAAVVGSGAASTGGSLIGAAGSAASMMAHNGGIAGHLTMSRNNIGVLGAAMKYHTGGIVGLQPDEVSAVLRKGEEILTEEDPRHRNNLGEENEPSGGQTNVRVVPVLDPSTIHDAMSSSQGEQVIIAVMKKNATKIRQTIGAK